MPDRVTAKPDRRLAITAAASVVAHVVLAHALDALPAHATVAPPHRVSVRIVESPAPPPDLPPPESPPPEPPPPEPPKIVHEAPRTKPVRAVNQAAEPIDAPLVETTNAPGTSTTPVFGISMTSTSQTGSMAAPVGNTTRSTPGATPSGPVAPLAAPVAAYEVTRMPVPQGRCSGTYTDAARAAGLEGTVVLDLVVDADGRARDIKVIENLGHGLTRAAIDALRACRFTPGERDGVAVAVRVRSFKIRFFLSES